MSCLLLDAVTLNATDDIIIQCHACWGLHLCCDVRTRTMNYFPSDTVWDISSIFTPLELLYTSDCMHTITVLATDTSCVFDVH